MHFKTERIILNVDIKHYECDWQCTGLDYSLQHNITHI